MVHPTTGTVKAINVTTAARSAACRPELGMTLVEAVVAIFLVTMVILGTASLHISTVDQQQYAGDITTFSGFASEKMEELVSRDPTLIAPGEESLTLPNGETIKRVWTVDHGKPVAGTMTVTVSVASGNDKHDPVTVAAILREQ